MKLAIFDIDGTLTDSNGYDRYFFSALAERIGLPEVPETSIGDWPHITDESIATEFFARFAMPATVEDLAWVKETYQEALCRHLTRVDPIRGAGDVLQMLRDDPEWHVAIATGNWTFAGERKLAAAGLDVSGIEVVGCDGLPRREDLMEAARDRCTSVGPFEHLVYVGDASWDVKATRALGWNFVGIRADRDRLLRQGATHVLADYANPAATREALQNAGVPAS